MDNKQYYNREAFFTDKSVPKSYMNHRVLIDLPV